MQSAEYVWGWSCRVGLLWGLCGLAFGLCSCLGQLRDIGLGPGTWVPARFGLKLMLVFEVSFKFRQHISTPEIFPFGPENR